jgi:2-polyprenyl-6-methoxyphenol hydroxylase-like FAD-dependent oxidoreductase
VAGGVRTTFERSGPRTFDLVVGADGLHSQVRRLAFGPESRFLRFLGYYTASFTIPDYQGLTDVRLNYNAPGRLVAVNADRTCVNVSFIFASEPLDIDYRDTDRQREVVATAFAGVGWETPRLISAMWGASDFYFDPICRVEMDRYVNDRVVLLGDAGYGAYGGMGTGLAAVGAYVLAGELMTSRHDHRGAFDRYQTQIRDYATKCQAVGSNTGRFFVPDTWEQIRRRNNAFQLMRDSRRMRDLFIDRTQQAASGISIVDYPARYRS